jgi:glycosyltransferase involved in cell wall biosynthesis
VTSLIENPGLSKASSRSSDRSLRVIVVSNHLEVKKRLPFAGIFTDRQIESLRVAGANVELFDLGAKYSFLHLLRKWFALRRQIRRFKPDVVHARYGTVVAFLSVMSGCPTVITFCGSDLNPGASVSIFRTYLGFLLSNLAALRAQRIICVSEGLRQTLWWGRNKTIVIADGIDLDLFSPGDRKEARQKLGWDDATPIVLFNLGDDAKKKGFDLARAATDELRNRIPSVQFEIVQHVNPGKMPLYYRAADVLLCTSMNEGSPNVVKESLACDLPVVSVPVGDVEERLRGVFPSAVVARNPKLIADALASILSDRTRSNGRSHVVPLGLPETAERILDVYISVVGR